MSPSDEDLRLVGGSDSAAVAGLHPRKTPLDVWRRIVEGYDVEQTRAMRRGVLLEPVIRQMYVDETGAQLQGPITIKAGHRRASLDDRTEEKVVEFKSANIRQAQHWGDIYTDEVPVEYLVQCQWYMHHARKHVADLVVLLGGDELRTYTLGADAELQGMLVEAAERFWTDYVETRTPPPIDGTESCREWLAARFPKESAPLLAATEEQEAVARRYFAIRDSIAELEREEAELRTRIQAVIGEAEGLRGDDWRITWKAVKGKTRTDFEAICREMKAPEHLIQKHTTVAGGYRRFVPFKKPGDSK